MTNAQTNARTNAQTNASTIAHTNASTNTQTNARTNAMTAVSESSTDRTHGPVDGGHRRAATDLRSESMEGSRLLVIEDDARIGSSLTRALEGSGYIVCWSPSACEGIDAFIRALAQNTPFRLVLLDLGLPDADGLDVCRALVRADPHIPVIMLTARDNEIDSVVGLDAGAVDYVTKPFSLSALLARIRAQLRRTDAENTNHVRAHRVMMIGTLIIDRVARRVTRNSDEILLRPKEFDLLVRLALDVGAAVTRETLMDDVWDTEWFGSTKTLDFHIAALRAKLDVASGPSVITTIRGVGFRLEK